MTGMNFVFEDSHRISVLSECLGCSAISGVMGDFRDLQSTTAYSVSFGHTHVRVDESPLGGGGAIRCILVLWYFTRKGE
jgi:hypothetical protein